MNGLIRGKRLVWVQDGKCWRAETQFGVYRAYECGQWELCAFDDWSTINEGETSSRELAQAECQADHDQRAMASVDVPIEWDGDAATCGWMRLNVWQVPESDEWQWDARYLVNPPFTYGIEDTRDDAVKTAETFVRQLVMGVQK